MIRSINLNSQGSRRAEDFTMQPGPYPSALPRYKMSDIMDVASQFEQGDRTPHKSEVDSPEKIAQLEQEIERMRNRLEAAKGNMERR